MKDGVRMHDLAFCCDDAYAPYLSATIASIIENCGRPASLRFWVVSETMSRATVQGLTRLAGQFGAALEFRRVSANDIPGGAPTHGHISTAAYFRFLLPSLLPVEASKVLYLDCDLIVVGDIRDFFAVDLCGMATGAVSNPRFDRYEALGMERGWGYCNSGVLLLDLEQWRSESIDKRIFGIIEGMGSRLALHDQDAVNIGLRGKWMALSPRFNLQSAYFFQSPNDLGVSKSELEDILRNPLVIHFSSALKPWHFDGWHPYRWLFFEYLRKSGWRGSVARPSRLRQVARYVRWRWKMGIRSRPRPPGLGDSGKWGGTEPHSEAEYRAIDG